MKISHLLHIVALMFLATILPSCTTTTAGTAAAPSTRPALRPGLNAPRVLRNVRTTAYTHTERGGRRNAIGARLSGSRTMSAASDWSRYPLGTRFRIVGTGEHFIIDDYGTALVGTNTIDLYKPSRKAMRNWGVRRVDIEVLQWGSDVQSLHVLKPRKRHRIVRRMIAGLERKKI